MGSLKSYDQADVVSLCERIEVKLEKSKEICKLDIRTRTEQLKLKLDEDEKSLLESVDQTCDQLTQQIQAASRIKAKETNIQELLNSVNIRFEASSSSEDKVPEQGFISHNEVLPSDISLNLVTEIRKLHTKAAIVLSLTAERPLFNTFLMKSLSIIIHPEGDPSVKVPHQHKITGETELKIRFKVQDEGVYLVSVRLYNHHIRQSPVLIPVLNDPVYGLAKLGLTMSGADNPDSSFLSAASELDISVKALRRPTELNVSETPEQKPDSNLKKSEKIHVKDMEEIPFKWNEKAKCLFEHKDGKKYFGQIAWRFRNNSGIPLYIVESVNNDIKVKATVGEEKLSPPSKSLETQPREATSPKIADVTADKVKEVPSSTEKPALSPVSSVIDDISPTEFIIGQAVVAWHEESWKPGMIHSVPSASLCIVKLAAGGFAGVSPNLLKPSPANVSKNTAQDCSNPTWKVGDFAIARWSQDNAWYNVKIMEIMEKIPGRKLYLVNFYDYGNQDVVEAVDIVFSSKYIPDRNCVDLNVNQDDECSEESEISEVRVEDEIIDDIREVKLEKKAQDTANLNSSGSNMKITFRNDQHKGHSSAPAPSPEDLSSLKCSLCSRCPPRKLYRLACDGSPVCWGCGVKQINVNHTCWVCKAKATSTSGHLVKESESGQESVGKERAARSLVDAASDIKIEKQPKKNCFKDSSLYTAARLNVSSFVKQGNEFPIVKVTGELTIKNKNGEEPCGMTVLDDESILICYGSGIARYDQEGQLVGRVKKGTLDFYFPSDVCKMTGGDVVVLDRKGLHLLDSSLGFIKTLTENNTTDKFGDDVQFSSLAEDQEGNILTLHNKPKNITTRASIFVFDMKREEPVQVMPLESLIDQAIEHLNVPDPNASLCTNLTYRDGRIYITDSGLHCIYVINQKEENICSLFGHRGNELGALNHPTNVVVDDERNTIVCDVKNHRLQVLRESDEESFIAKIIPDQESPFTGPCVSFLDHRRGKLYVGNKLSKRVVRYSFEE